MANEIEALLDEVSASLFAEEGREAYNSRQFSRSIASFRYEEVRMRTRSRSPGRRTTAYDESPLHAPARPAS